MSRGPFGWLRRLVGKDEYDCRDVAADCSEYVDEELSERDAQRFDSHLDDCPDCPPYVATFKATVMTIVPFHLNRRTGIHRVTMAGSSPPVGGGAKSRFGAVRPSISRSC